MATLALPNYAPGRHRPSVPRMGQAVLVAQKPANPLDWRAVGFVTMAAAAVLGFMVAPKVERCVRDGGPERCEGTVWKWVALGVATLAAVKGLNDYSKIT